MALGFRRKTLHQKDHQKSAEDRRKKYPVAEPARSLRDIGVVEDAESAIVKQVVKEADERPQGDGAKAGHDAHDQRKPAKNQQTYPSLIGS